MKKTSSRASGCSGFTLIELLVTISVLLVLVAAAAPSMVNMIQRNRLQASADRLIEGLSVARNEAIKRGITVALDQQNPSSNGWTSGWMILSGGTTLFSSGPLGQITFVAGSYIEGSSGNAFTVETSLKKIAFARDGTRQEPSGLTFKALIACDVTNPEGNPYKGVLIFPNGMVQVKSKAELKFLPDPCK